MTPNYEQLMQAVDDGLTQREAAARFGCGRTTIQRLTKKHAIHWPHYGNFRSSSFVEIGGKRMSLAEAARRYGLTMSLVWRRYRSGDRGERLVRPVREISKPPESYHTGFSMKDWQVVVDTAKELTPRAAARKFDIPLGAVNAALRGEWMRLG